MTAEQARGSSSSKRRIATRIAQICGILIGIVVLIIVCLLSLYVLFNGFVEDVKCGHVTGFLNKIACGMSVTRQVFSPYFRSLPTDEEMIAHFHKHREDFERLVQIYQDDATQLGPLGLMKPDSEALEIMQRIRVTSVVNDGTLWLPPDPYSEEAQREIKDRNLVNALYEGRGDTRKFTGLIMGYGHKRVRRFRMKDDTQVGKDFYYVPVVPRLEHGRLWTGVSQYEDAYSDLNIVPPKMEGLAFAFGYCRFEPQWFIRMFQRTE